MCSKLRHEAVWTEVQGDVGPWRGSTEHRTLSSWETAVNFSFFFCRRTLLCSDTVVLCACYIFLIHPWLSHPPFDEENL
jgi:hypothetical protein